ncbi:periplasmic heavy metal sensor [Solidesulfovibrio sp.]|uniref:periplasmic heavy metal sensor n=1 Tax=Solidesulfovibrio sp. TaxID=2910990 RepID=UPI002620454C|nr:periplasmic heavy metal sensor [Solidesulfovibrio sp.]
MLERPENGGWRRFALPCSILLNLFLVAVIGGHLYSRYADHPRGKTMEARLLARVEATLAPPEAAAFKAVLSRDEPKFKEARKRLAAARTQLLREITADPYSKEGMATALRDWKTAWDGFAGAFAGTLVEALAQVSPEGRAKLVAEHWQRRFGIPAP